MTATDTNDTRIQQVFFNRPLISLNVFNQSRPNHPTKMAHDVSTHSQEKKEYNM